MEDPELDNLIEVVLESRPSEEIIASVACRELPRTGSLSGLRRKLNSMGLDVSTRYLAKVLRTHCLDTFRLFARKKRRRINRTG